MSDFIIIYDEQKYYILGVHISSTWLDEKNLKALKLCCKQNCALSAKDVLHIESTIVCD